MFSSIPTTFAGKCAFLPIFCLFSFRASILKPYFVVDRLRGIELMLEPVILVLP